MAKDYSTEPGRLWLLDDHEVAAYLDLDTRTITAARERGEFAYYRLGRRVYTRWSDVLEWLEARRVYARPLAHDGRPVPIQRDADGRVITLRPDEDPGPNDT